MFTTIFYIGQLTKSKISGILCSWKYKNYIYTTLYIVSLYVGDDNMAYIYTFGETLNCFQLYIKSNNVNILLTISK